MSTEAPIVSLLAMGEGWHNYHHVFPWDYKTGEFGNYSLNITTGFIDFCAWLGLAKGREFYLLTSYNESILIYILTYLQVNRYPLTWS